MHFQFDPNQEYQLRAVEAVVDLFEGQPSDTGRSFELRGDEPPAMPNQLVLDERDILANLQQVQRHNNITPDDALRAIQADVAGEQVGFPNFSVEMETGTGKTYVYIRTMLELHRRYAMRKFIVVVPSVAVREGVLKTFRQTEEHFRSIFDNVVYRSYEYDSSSLSRVRQFAQSDAVEVMVMTIDSFNKSGNIIVRAMDQMQGQVPIDLIRAARPILILDEPQNYESETSKAALASLRPLFALRYSATHRVPYNVVYRLTPYQAYRQGLVKRIKVASVVAEGNEARPFVRLEAVNARGGSATAKLRVHRLSKNGTVAPATVTVKPGDSLEAKARRSDYAGFEVDTVDPVQGLVRFAPSDVELHMGEEIGTDKRAIFRAQIEETIETHLKTQERLRSQGVKVLSLFFIDRVDNYAGDEPMIRRLFDEVFDKLKAEYEPWRELPADEVQAAYFASKRRKGGEVELRDSSTGESQDDTAAYDLIMKDKEALLSFPDDGDDEETRRKKHVAFIFSHSALREGWDNPNVFQICTLNQSASEMRKRQEVGRGVRLARDQAGRQLSDERVNVLTVIANESYERYVATLQSEIAEEYQEEIEARYGKPIGDLTVAERAKIAQEYGEGILPPPPPPAKGPEARLRKERLLSPEFRELWDRIRHKTRYSVQVDTQRLLAEAVPAIDRATIEPPRVTVTEAVATVGEAGFEAAQTRAARTAATLTGRGPLPNLLELMVELMDRTVPRVRLTRATLLEVVRRTKQQRALVQNPHEFAGVAVAALKDRLLDQLVEGIKYEKDGAWWDMSRIEEEDLVELFSKHAEPAENALYDRIGCDSDVERDFVRDLEHREDVKFYMKLPGWFKIATPLGEHNPDWAVVMEDEAGEPRLYLVAETKGSLQERERRGVENMKIACAARHFGSHQLGTAGALDGVDYQVVKRASELGAGSPAHASEE